MLGQIFSQLFRRTPDTAGKSIPLAHDARTATTDSRALLRQWLAADVHPPFTLADLQADPRRCQVALALATGQELPAARTAAQALTALDPSSMIDRLLLAEVLLRLGDIAKAQEITQEALADAGTMGARAASMQAEQALFLGRIRVARELAERALAAAPEALGPHVVLACALDAQGPAHKDNYQRALRHHERAMMLRLDSPMPRFHLAGSLLRRGQLREGLMQWVLVEIQGGIYTNREKCPVWTGAPLQGQSLLLISHSGLGDMVQFLRFAGILRERSPRARLVFLTSAPVARLARATGWFDAVHEQSLQGEDFDWQVTITHLPLLLDIQASDLRKTEPYLAVPAEQIHSAALGLPKPVPGRRRVGLRWAGNAGLLDAKRNIPLELCAPWFAVPDIDWVALVEDGQAAAQARNAGLTVPTTRLGDFQDTGAVMCNLDLIISVDTSVANLAGALNLPTWVLSRPDPDWRWGESGPDSPWYGSARVFRHPPGEGLDWKAMVSEVESALREWVASHAAAPVSAKAAGLPAA